MPQKLINWFLGDDKTFAESMKHDTLRTCLKVLIVLIGVCIVWDITHPPTYTSRQVVSAHSASPTNVINLDNVGTLRPDPMALQTNKVVTLLLNADVESLTANTSFFPGDLSKKKSYKFDITSEEARHQFVVIKTGFFQTRRFDVRFGDIDLTNPLDTKFHFTIVEK